MRNTSRSVAPMVQSTLASVVRYHYQGKAAGGDSQRTASANRRNSLRQQPPKSSPHSPSGPIAAQTHKVLPTYAGIRVRYCKVTPRPQGAQFHGERYTQACSPRNCHHQHRPNLTASRHCRAPPSEARPERNPLAAPTSPVMTRHLMTT